MGERYEYRTLGVTVGGATYTVNRHGSFGGKPRTVDGHPMPSAELMAAMRACARWAHRDQTVLGLLELIDGGIVWRKERGNAHYWNGGGTRVLPRDEQVARCYPEIPMIPVVGGAHGVEWVAPIPGKSRPWGNP
jgi:hypothetical protein